MEEETFSEKFARLTEQWKEETKFSSGTPIDNEAYREIIAMGEEALPLIFQDMATHRGHWFHALHEMTGENPVPPVNAGRVRLMEEAWLSWAKNAGYWKDETKDGHSNSESSCVDEME